MKTPREILLARHHRVDPKLDKLREHTIATLRNAPDSKRETSRGSSPGAAGFLAELLGFSPKFWTGLASAWVVILALKFSTVEESAVIARPPVASPQANLPLQQRKLLLAELSGFFLEAKPAVTSPPRPHGSRHTLQFKV